MCLVNRRAIDRTTVCECPVVFNLSQIASLECTKMTTKHLRDSCLITAVVLAYFEKVLSEDLRSRRIPVRLRGTGEVQTEVLCGAALGFVWAETLHSHGTRDYVGGEWGFLVVEVQQ